MKKVYITYVTDPIYPEDFEPVTCFHDTLEEAETYAKQAKADDMGCRIYEAIRVS